MQFFIKQYITYIVISSLNDTLIIIYIIFIVIIIGKPAGYDRVRNAEIGVKNVTLHVVDEAYTTEHWLVRIYRVKDYDNRGGKMKPNKVSTYYDQ